MSGEFNRPLRWLRRRRTQIRTEVDDELRFHLETRIAHLQARGLSAVAAREEALRQFGNFEETREACVHSDERREQSVERRRYFDEVRHDVLHGLRQMRRRWQVTVLAALTLGIGVGAATAIFGATDHVLLRPLPYDDAAHAFTLWETDEQSGDRRLEVSPGNFLEWQKRSQSFAALGLAEPYSFDLQTDGPPQAVQSWQVTEGWFAALGVQPVAGRLFAPAEYQRNAAPVVLISEGLWQRQFAGDPQAIGQALRLDGRMATIVGVVSADVKYPEATDIWSPKVFRDDELLDRQSGYMRVAGRLAAGVTSERAHAELSAIARQMQAEFPTTNRVTGINLVPLEEQILGRIRPALLILLGAVAFLLLIACANVASLLLASGAERSKELAVRASLGAGRNRLVHQLATESLLLALSGGVLGILVARLGMRALILLSPPDLPRIEHLAVDGRVLVVSMLITLCTAVVFGLAPALRFSRPDLLSTLRASGRSTTAGRGRHRLRAALVVSEVALALVLLIGAGLLMRSFVRLLGNDLGFEVENRASIQAFLWDRNPGTERLLQTATRIEETLRQTPGVLGAGIVSALPFHPHAIDAQTKLRIDGVPVPENELPAVYTTIVSATYFRTMGIELRAGRAFTERDRADAPRVVIINESLARRYFPGQDAVGKRITVGAMSRPESREIVGVVQDVRPLAVDSDARPELYVPLLQTPNGSLTFVVHTERAAAALLPVLRERLWSVDAGQSIYWSATLEQLVGATLMERRFQLIVLATFSVIALVLATIGIYGLISFATQQRTAEIGVRMALGAERRQIVRMIVGQGVRLVVPGVLIGVAGALALTRFLQGMLYGVTATDPVTFLQIALLVLAVAALASWLPARRAVRGSPLGAILKE